MEAARIRREIGTTGPRWKRLNRPNDPISSAVSNTAGMTMEKCSEATTTYRRMEYSSSPT